MPLRILLDEDLSPSLAPGLWELGLDATSMRDRGMLGLKDWELLLGLAQEGWTLCTGNGDEWERRALQWSEAGKVLVNQEWGTDGIARALRTYLTEEAPDALLNEVVRVLPPGET